MLPLLSLLLLLLVASPDCVLSPPNCALEGIPLPYSFEMKVVYSEVSNLIEVAQDMSKSI